uniref:Uncharacterized protein n=1 Tax=Aegilops tauschii subsp. strangulata TaxID=200361 RepID=A0A453AE80_AEGTS
MKTLYSTVASPVLILKAYVVASAYPRAKRKMPVPPMTGISRMAAEAAEFRPMMAMLLPLYLPPAVKTKFMFMSTASSSLPELTYMPCARPTSLDELRSGPSVSASSMTYTPPNRVLDELVDGARATSTAVGLGPLYTSCQYTLMCVVVSCSDMAMVATAKTRTRKRGTTAILQALVLLTCSGRCDARGCR